jgi:predicted phosphodiesterase
VSKLRIVAVSDTHGRHRDLEIPECDLFIHCGDYTARDSMVELPMFSEWVNSLPCKDKLLVAGNHDKCFESNPDWAYKEFSGMVSTFGGFPWKNYVIFCSSIQPVFNNWSFNLTPEQRRARYDHILTIFKNQIQILVTHCPPKNILDVAYNKHLGDPELSRFIEQLPNMKLHIFGHIHGMGPNDPVTINGVTYINASVLNDRYELVRKPRIYEI